MKGNKGKYTTNLGLDDLGAALDFLSNEPISAIDHSDCCMRVSIKEFEQMVSKGVKVQRVLLV